MEEYLLEAKQALGYPLEPSENYGDDNLAEQFDTLLYLAFQHPHCERTNARHVRTGHSRLGVLGHYMLEMALCELFFQRYPRESPEPMRERVYALIGKRFLPRWIKAASLHNLVFPHEKIENLQKELEDVDYVSVEFDGRKLSWQGPPEDALFAHPRVFRACVPPGMHRFRGNIWDYDSKPQIAEARNIEVRLGLQLCFLHPSKYKFEHPRFCFKHLEYVGQKIQDLVMAERLLMKHLDAPGRWEKYFHRFIMYSELVQDAYKHNRRLRNPATTSVQHAIHGLAYAVYGKQECLSFLTVSRFSRRLYEDQRLT
ncbi:hypothetical protein Pfo_019365 [Paulownia fortunei]|nr:hypothetical protein Pfo_019365 [Paulownia fortunei]